MAKAALAQARVTLARTERLATAGQLPAQELDLARTSERGPAGRALGLHQGLAPRGRGAAGERHLRLRRLGDPFRVETRVVLWRGADVLQVPGGALFRSGDGWAVYRVEGGRARKRPVRLGHRGTEEAEVLSGLTAGDRVILHPGDRVDEGARVVGR